MRPRDRDRRARKCCVCQQGRRPVVCRSCGDSMDKSTNGDMTHAALIRWAANRARLFAAKVCTARLAPRLGLAVETARKDRSAVCAMGDLLLSGNKQCYSADAVLRMVRRLIERPSVRTALAECKADAHREVFGDPTPERFAEQTERARPTWAGGFEDGERNP